MATQARYYPRNTVIPVVIPKKSCFCQEGKKPWRYIQIFTKPWPLSCPNRLLSVVQRTSLGSYWEGSEVRVKVSPSEQKKKIFGEAALFFLFLFFFFFWTFCQMSTFTSFSLVSLTLALHAPNSAYAFSMSPPLDPCLHIDEPRCTYVADPPQTDVLCLYPLIFQAAEA